MPEKEGALVLSLWGWERRVFRFAQREQLAFPPSFFKVLCFFNSVAEHTGSARVGLPMPGRPD